MSLCNFVSKIRAYSGYAGTLFLARRCIRLAHHEPLISFTFDDFPRSALNCGGAILEENGLAATYYAAFGLMNSDGPVGRIFSEEDLHELVARDHELGCHTFDHCDAWKTPPKHFEQSILRNHEVLKKVLPGNCFATLSYPRSHPRPQTKHNAEEYFLCCRGGGQTFNSGTADLNYLKAFFLEQSWGNADMVKALIDRNCRRGGWLIFATHDVVENPSRYGCTPRFFTDIVQHAVASGATILPVAAALKKTRGQVLTHAAQF